MNRRILFVTGTRADFGKLEPLIRACERAPFDVTVLATGMHLSETHGYTLREVRAAGFKNVHLMPGLGTGAGAERCLAAIIDELCLYLRENPADLIVVHGDRIEALAGAIVGSLSNRRVAHVEGGELSGSIDNSLRHAISKLAHFHFVSNAESQRRLIQMGERADTIGVIGSPATERIVAGPLPDLATVKHAHGIPFARYAIALFHPVTTELSSLPGQARALTQALLRSGLCFVVIDPNNDEGFGIIHEAYRSLDAEERFRRFRSLPFEDFAALLAGCELIIGNSSAGVREAPAIAVPSVNVGSRQADRFRWPGILNVQADCAEILAAIDRAQALKALPRSDHFREKGGVDRFVETLAGAPFWELPLQKGFRDLT